MKGTNKVYIQRSFSCSIQELFNWLVEPTLIVQWFGPKQFKTGAVESNLKVGGSYKIELIKPNGAGFYIVGNYIEIKRPYRLVFSFKYEGVVQSPPESTVEFLLENIGDGVSRLSLTQKFEVMPSDFETRTKTWESMLIKLGALTEG